MQLRIAKKYVSITAMSLCMFTTVHNKHSGHMFKWYEDRRRFDDAKIRTRHLVKLYVYFVVCFVLNRYVRWFK